MQSLMAAQLPECACRVTGHPWEAWGLPCADGVGRVCSDPLPSRQFCREPVGAERSCAVDLARSEQQLSIARGSSARIQS